MFQREDGDNDNWVATFENLQLLEKYRSYRADAFYEYRKSFSAEGIFERFYDFTEKDLIGFSKYYYDKQKGECDLPGGEVSMVCCQNGFYYRIDQYAWMYLVMIVAIETVLSVIVAAVVSAIILLVKRKKSASQN